MTSSRGSAAAVLEVHGLRVGFPVRRTMAEFSRGPGRVVQAVDGVDLTAMAGEVVALVGESGSGKTTLAQAILRLLGQSRARIEGNVLFDGTDVFSADRQDLRALRTRMQMIYQDPYGALNPSLRVWELVEEPLRIHRLRAGANERSKLIGEALERVSLSPELVAHRFPHELSGGERQRVAIASALTLQPLLLVADEPVSMLDMSVRAGVLSLLVDLSRSGMTILMVTHDLSSAAHYSDRIAIMYLGRIVEEGPTSSVLAQPTHPYTKALLAAVPELEGESDAAIKAPYEVPDASNIPTGCRFHPRCPVAIPQCRVIDPDLTPATLQAPQHLAACILVGSRANSHTEGDALAPQQAIFDG